MRQLLFIAGIMGRSGTNFLADLLLQHPDICRPVGHWELPVFEVIDRYEDFYAAFISRRKAGRINLSWHEFAKGFGNSLQEILERKVVDTDYKKHTLLHKNPGTIGIEYFHLFFPDARLIFLVRDGRDNVNSLLATAGMYKSKLMMIKRAYLLYHYSKEWSNSAKRIADYSIKNNVYIIKYENLVNSTREELITLADYCGLNINNEWLSTINSNRVRGSSFYGTDNNIRVEEKPGIISWKPLEKTSSFKPIGRWRKYWSSLDCWLFNKAAAEGMQQLGY